MPPNYGPRIGDERFFEGRQVRCTDIQAGLPGRIYFEDPEDPGWVSDNFVSPTQWIELPHNAAEHNQRIESSLSTLADHLMLVIRSLSDFEQRLKHLEDKNA